MQFEDLTREEKLALFALVRLLIRSDGDFSEEEEAQINEMGERMGGVSAIWKWISDSAQAYPEDEDIRRAAGEVKRDAARLFILDVLREVAEPDGIADEEVALLDWLRATWAPSR